jgi:hypothetical protein
MAYTAAEVCFKEYLEVVLEINKKCRLSRIILKESFLGPIQLESLLYASCDFFI